MYQAAGGTMSKVLLIVRVVFFVLLVVFVASVSWVAGGASKEFDCTNYCEIHAERISMHDYLGCKAMCHDMSIAHVRCVFNRLTPGAGHPIEDDSDEPQDEPIEEFGPWEGGI
jgi:hypothetical protein